MYRVQICYNSDKTDYKDEWIRAFHPETLELLEDYPTLDIAKGNYFLTRNEWTDVMTDLRRRKPTYMKSIDYIKGFRIIDTDTFKVVF